MFFLNNPFFVSMKKEINPKIRNIELWIKLWAKKKLVTYDKIVINKIPLKPNSPKESRSEKNFFEINPNPIIENKIIR